MPLRITRAVDTVLFGGWDLDPSDLEGSCDHRIWVRRVRDTDTHQDALVNIETPEGVVEEIITEDEPIQLERRDLTDGRGTAVLPQARKVLQTLWSRRPF